MIQNTIALLIVALTASAVAAPIQFNFKDPKGVNNVVFKTDAPLESINGTASGISILPSRTGCSVNSSSGARRGASETSRKRSRQKPARLS